jgi:hypothetical protein
MTNRELRQLDAALMADPTCPFRQCSNNVKTSSTPKKELLLIGLEIYG